MKIKLLQAMAGPDGAHHAGAVVDLEDKKAEELIKGHYAIKAPVKLAPKPAAARKDADVDGPKESTQDKGGPKGKDAR